MADKIEGLINQQTDQLREIMDQKWNEALKDARAALDPNGSQKGAQTSYDRNYYEGLTNTGVASKTEAVARVEKSATSDKAYLDKRLKEGAINKDQYNIQIKELEQEKTIALKKIDTLVENANGAASTRSKEYAKFKNRVEEIQKDYIAQAEKKIATLADVNKQQKEIENFSKNFKGMKLKQKGAATQKTKQKPVTIDFTDELADSIIRDTMDKYKYSDGSDDMDMINNIDWNKAITKYQKEKNVKIKNPKKVNIGAQLKSQVTKNKTAFTDNSYITETFKNLGTDVSQLVDSQLTADYYQKEIISAANAAGLGAKFVGNKLQLWSKDAGTYDQAKDKNLISSIDFLDINTKSNTISKNGGMPMANTAKVTTQWKKDSSGNSRQETVLMDAFTLQYKKALEKYFRVDNEGKVKDNKLIKAVKGGDIKTARSIGNLAVKEAVGNAPGNMSQAVISETDKDLYGVKTNEQAFVRKGAFDISELATQMAYQNKEFFEGWYAKKGKKFDATSVAAGDEINQALNTIYSLMSTGNGEAEIAKMLPDSLAKAIMSEVVGRDEQNRKAGTTTVTGYEDRYGNKIADTEYKTTFHRTMSQINKIISAGLVPKMESVKEEGILRGRFSVAGASQLNPFGMFMDTSNRAPDQVANYIRRANDNNFGKTSMFSSALGIKNGVDYNSRERQQYTGFMANDDEILKAMERLPKDMFSEQEKAYLSTREGGILMPQSMANELEGYRYAQDEIKDKDITIDELSKLGLNLDQVMGMKQKEQLHLNQKLYEGMTFGGKEYSAGSIIKSIQRTEQGLQLNVDMLEKVKNGTKILTEAGGRQTARVVEGNENYNSRQKWEALMGAIAAERGVSPESMTNAKWITEQKDSTTKAMGFEYIGRLANIVNESGKSAAEVLSALRDTTEIGKAFDVGKDGKLQSTIQMERTGEGFGKYTYADPTTGKKRDLFNYDESNTAGQAEMAMEFVEDLPAFVKQLDAYTQALIEEGRVEDAAEQKALADMLRGKESNISAFGKALLGDKYTANMKAGLEDQFVNQANEVPYMNSTGSGGADIVEKEGRVKFGYRERDANIRAINSALVDATENVTEGLNLLTKAEEEATNRYGEKGREAQAHQKAINEMLTDNGVAKEGDWKYGIAGYTMNASTGGENDEVAKTAVISFDSKGGILLDGKPISGTLSMTNDNNEEMGITREEYDKTVLGQVRELMKATGKANLVIKGTHMQGNKTMSVYDMGEEKAWLSNGNYMAPQTDKVINGIIKDIQQGFDEEDGNKDKAVGAFKTAKEEYDRIANHKDSKLYKQATESNVSNSSFFKMIGLNGGNVEQQQKDANRVYATSEKVKSLYRTQEGAGKSALISNIKQLIYQNEKAKDSSIESVNAMVESLKLDEQSIEQLKAKEESVLNEMIHLAKTGDLDLTAQTHRYPSTSGLDVRYSSLGINDEMGNDDALIVPRGLAATFNAGATCS